MVKYMEQIFPFLGRPKTTDLLKYIEILEQKDESDRLAKASKFIASVRLVKLLLDSVEQNINLESLTDSNSEELDFYLEVCAEMLDHLSALAQAISQETEELEGKESETDGTLPSSFLAV